MSELEDKLGNILNSPEKMSQIMQFAKNFSAADAKAPSSADGFRDDGGAPSTGGQPLDIDPQMLQTMARLFGEFSSESNSRSTALLSAIKPYLKEERREKVDKAVQIAKMARLARTAFGSMGGDGLV